MLGKPKKTVSLAYKNKLIADITYYEKRIEEALHKKKHTSFYDVENSDDDSNPYTLNIGRSGFNPTQQEMADLRKRVSMTLELAMLTIVQSEVNIMVTAPDVRRPVKEDGTWQEVAAECKIDLVSFTITFYAHKPLRQCAPTRYRSVVVTLTKAAHEKELAKSVLPKQNRPNLAIQVLQSYATAFRSRRTTLLELAQKYADQMRMEAMPEGGYSVKFLDLLTVEWTLENMWSPIAPFSHRMKFEVEYMPEEYIHRIGRVYKQFKDPSLVTSDRTEILSEIFDTCLEARGPARDLQESFESDPETTGRLHERRTTIDQEPEPPSHIPPSPKKLSKGKENKAQNSKTNMAPPKTIPKKAKKVAHDKKRPNDEAVTSDNRMNKTNEENGTHVTKKSKPNEKGDTVENRKGVKRGAETEQNSEAKKIRTDVQNANYKSKSGYKADSQAAVADDDGGSSSTTLPSVSSKSNKTVATSKNVTNKDNPDTTKTLKVNGAGDTDANAKKDAKKATKTINSKNKDEKGNVASSQNVAKNRNEVESIAYSETVEGTISKNSTKKADAKTDANLKHKDTEANMASAKNSTKKANGKVIANPKDSNERHDGESVVGTKTTESTNVSSKNSVKKGNAKNVDKNFEESNKKQAGSDVTTKVSKKKNGDSTSVASPKNIKAKDSGGDTRPKNVNKKVNDGKNEAPSKNSKDNDVYSVAISKSGTKRTIDNFFNIATNAEGRTTKIDGNTIERRSSNNGSKKNNTEKAFKKNNIPDQIAEDDNKTKQKETNKVPDKNKNSNTKTDVNNQQATKNTNKDGAIDTKAKSAKGQKTDQSNKVTGEKSETKKIENNVQKNNKNKVTKPDSGSQNKLNTDKNKKLTTLNVERPKTVVPKATAGQVSNKNLNKNDPKETMNRNEMVEKIDENNKDTLKIATKKISNTQSNATKPQNNNPKAALLKKQTVTNIPKKQSEITFKKFQENQAKIAQNLKTKIPMLKNKIGISSLSEKVKGVDKRKTPLKRLPVFKKIVKNVPTRVSPRKLPSTLKSSLHGFFNK